MLINFRYLLAPITLAATAVSLFAAEPTIRNLDIRGLKIGGTTTITIDGDDLGKAPRLLLPFTAKQTLKAGATDKKATFDVTLADDVEPGYHHLRLVSDGGVSLPVLIGVDRLTQQSIAAPVKALPVALHGTIAGSGSAEAKFPGKAKERVMIEIESHRLGGKLRPVLHLYNSKKLQVTWAWGTPQHFGDARLEAILPADDTYTVSLHDAEYAAPAPSFFRMKIGQWTSVDQVFPPAIATGQPWTISLLGSGVSQSMTLQAAKSADVMPLPWPGKKSDLASGPRPFVTVSPHAEYVESPKGAKLQEIPEGRAGVSGKLETANEEDLYRVAVQAGKKIKFEVFAERLGSPIDVALVVRNEKGVQLARAEDSPGTLDPALEYTVPDKVTSLIVGVVDAQGRGGARGIYRLVIEPHGAIKDNFKLTTTVQRLSLAEGGRGMAPVFVDRKGGYAGAIELFADPPSPGLKLNGATIPPGADGTLMTVERTESPPVVLTLRGRTDQGSAHAVVIKGHPLERLQPWLAQEFAIAGSNEAANEFTIDWRDFSTDAALVPASKLKLPVKLTRPMGKTTVKLTLVTSQNPPILNNQPDPNKALRQDKLGDLAANVNSGDVTVLVPADLSAPVYDVTVQAELLDPAKKVLATTYAPVRRMQVNIPIAVTLAGGNRIEVPLDAKKGAVLKLQGKLERRGGLKADVAIALTGLPAGAKAETVIVKGDAADFTVNITFPPTVASSEITGVKLSGSYVPDAKQPNVRVKSREVEVTLVLKAPIK
jgi:hypothetical protein